MTPWLLYIFFGSLALASLLILGLEIRDEYRRFRGVRIVTCPTDGTKASVALKPWRAALPAAFGKIPVLQLIDCSRWPEQCDCDERCLEQITVAPEETLLRSILAEHFLARKCAFCGAEFLPESAARVRALVANDGLIVDTIDIPPDRIEELVTTHEPVCGRCFGQMALLPGEKAYIGSRRRISRL